MVKKILSFFQKSSHPESHNNQTQSQDAHFLACREVQQNIKTVAAFLKERLSTSKAFQQVAWYLVLGGKNTGKTHLISKSTLSFLEKNRFVQLTPEGMETKSGVNWWLSSGAALIDVPGVYLEKTTHLTPERTAWLELLRQIKRYRFRRPLNGIILVIDVFSLQHNPEAGKEMRARIEEILYRLKQNLPFYLVVTKMDKLKGFQEYFDDLGEEEREQYSGLSFSLQDRSKTSWTVLFSEAFDRFLSHLHQRVLWRLHQEWEPSKRHAILNFPHQLNTLKENLRVFIHEINSLKAHASLRGIYFTSSLRDEEPVQDYINETVEQHFALTPLKSSSLPVRSQRPFFVKALFEQKIFPEASLAHNVLRTTASRQEDLLRWIALGLAGIILLSITLTLSQRYKHQTAYLHAANAALSDYKLLSLSYTSTHLTWDKLLPALDALAIAHQNAAAAQLPWLLRFQLHQHAPLSELTKQLYHSDLQTKLIPQVRDKIAKQLETGEITDSVQLYGLLKVYLMLGDPSHVDKAFLKYWFNQVWKDALMQNTEFRKHWEAAIEGQIPTLSYNTELIQKTRAALNALPYPLLSEAILRNEIFSSASTVSTKIDSNLLPQVSIQSMYTVEAIGNINTHINNALYTAIHGNWVLGNKVSDEPLSPEALKALQENLMNEYVENYVEAWQRYISQMQMISSHSLDQLEWVLQVFTQDHSPFEKVLNFIQHNTRLYNTHADNNALTTALQNKLNIQFNALNTFSLKSLYPNLQAVKLQLHSITHSQHPEISAWEMAKNMAVSKKPDPIVILMQQASTLPEPLKSWLLSIAHQSRDFILNRASFYTWQQWQLQVLPLCRASLEEHYPIEKSAPKDILLSDFKRFFEKGGIFNQFFMDYLSPFVETHTAMWRWKNIDGAVLDKDNSRLSQFERAHIIQELYFNGNNQLLAAFSLSPDSHSGDHHEVYRSYTWPLNTAEITVTLMDSKGNKKFLKRSGDWSIFKLIDAAKLTPHANGKTYDLVFADGNYKAVYTLNAANLINPFVPGVIEQFRCP